MARRTARLLVLAGLSALLVSSCRPSATVPAPDYRRVEARGAGADCIWSLDVGTAAAWPATWVLCGERLLATVAVGEQGIEGTVFDPAAQPLQRFSLPWERAPAAGETLHLVFQNNVLRLVRDGVVIHSVSFPADCWTDDFWRLPVQADHRLRRQRLAAVFFADDFMHAEGSFGAWTRQGEWCIDTVRNPLRDVNAFQLAATGEPALLTAGYWFWRDYGFCVSATCGTGSVFSLLACRDEAGRSYELRVAQGEQEAVLTLFRHLPSGTCELATASRSPLPGWNRLGLRVHEGRIQAEVNGQDLLVADDSTPLAFGGIGLEVSRLGSGRVVFDDVEVTPLLSPEGTSLEPPLVELVEDNHDVFSSEESMAEWSEAQGDWQQVGAPEGGQTTYLHRADLWSDFRLLLKAGPETLVHGIRLYCDGDDLGMVASLDLVDSVWHLRQDGTDVPLAATAGTDLVCELRSGRLLAGTGQTVLETLPTDSAGCWRVGVVAVSPPRDWVSRVSLGAAKVHDYLFRRAPVDWLPVSGRWDATYRWQCDPRWSFYTGRHLAGTAVNWFRLAHGRNVTLEFFAAPRMNRERGEDYGYAADLNATLGARGCHLDQGCSFLYGGFHNQGSQIVAAGQVLAENRELCIPADKKATHRHWFRIKIRKQGDRVRWWIDDRPAGTAALPAGIDGDRLALWTWRNEMVVGRVRISSDSFVRVADADEAAAMAAGGSTAYPVAVEEAAKR